MKKRILITSYSDINSDPRVRREIEWLADDYDIITIGLNDSTNYECIEHLQIMREDIGIIKKGFFAIKLRLNMFTSFYNLKSKGVKEAFRKVTIIPDLILSNDIEMLGPSINYSNKINKPIIYDSHEYTPLQFEQNFTWRLFQKNYYHWVCGEFLPKADKIITVCDGIGQKYTEEFDIEKPVIITNSTGYNSKDIETKKKSNQPLEFIHHGILNPNRKLELIIEAIGELGEEYALTLMLMKPKFKVQQRYLNKLNRIIRRYNNINIVDPVPFDKIIESCRSYDLGIIFYKPNGFNIVHSLPNKFFEYIQARLPVLIGPSVEMKNIVLNNDIGFVTEDFTVHSLKKMIMELKNSDILKKRENLNKYAYELSSEKNKEKLRNLISGYLK